MNNEELKEKIVKVLKEAFTERDVIPVHTAPDGEKTALPDELCEIFNDIVVQAVIPYFADALILEGIGYVWDITEKAEKAIASLIKQNKKLQHRAEVAEKALLMACANAVKDEKDNVNIELLVRVVYDKYLKQAEKELAEERKDD